jgi:peptide chain release factor 1
VPLKAETTRRRWSAISSPSTPATATTSVFNLALLDERPGLAIVEITGKHAAKLFAHEPGGHRWQRVPPNDKRGRRQTSTITVAVMPAPADASSHVDERDIRWQATRGSGKGGQARNKTSNAVIMKHLPTGLQVRVESERSLQQNRAAALRLLAARIAAIEQEKADRTSTEMRRAQVGSGQRGDKVRTIRTQDDSVVQHATGKRTTVARYLKGHLEDLC